MHFAFHSSLLIVACACWILTLNAISQPSQLRMRLRLCIFCACTLCVCVCISLLFFSLFYFHKVRVSGEYATAADMSKVKTSQNNERSNLAISSHVLFSWCSFNVCSFPCNFFIWSCVFFFCFSHFFSVYCCICPVMTIHSFSFRTKVYAKRLHRCTE